MNTMNRRQFLGVTLMGLAGLAGAARAQGNAAGARRLNVLHIMSDDLRARLACYGDPLVKTPHLDRLAARAVRFDKAYCQYPLCNPSRASYMTGMRPDTIRVYNNEALFRDAIPDAVTLPQSFQKAGYAVARVGKIYHYGVPREIGTDGLDDPASWDKVVNPKGRDIDDADMIEVLKLGEDGVAGTVKDQPLTAMGGTLSWLAAEGGDDEQTDGRGALAAVKLLEEYAAGNTPFYLAVGFYRPHTPFVAPKKYFADYPLEAIEVPAVPDHLNELFPRPALMTQKPAEVAMGEELRKKAIQAYTASTAFMDAQVGVLLDALDRLGLADNTVVVFHSDHGYLLGEKNLWMKQSLFEESARVPLIIAMPGAAKTGVCERTVELVSLHRTLTEVCGVAVDERVQGYSMAPLLENPKATWNHAAYTQVRRLRDGVDIMGRAVRTERWRYIEWNEGEAGVELYDHEADPHEMVNLAGRPDMAKRQAELQALLRRGGG